MCSFILCVNYMWAQRGCSLIIQFPPPLAFQWKRDFLLVPCEIPKLGSHIKKKEEEGKKRRMYLSVPLVVYRQISAGNLKLDRKCAVAFIQWYKLYI